jgi:hypothetical protein
VYEVLVERTAERDLQSLPQAILKRIVPLKHFPTIRVHPGVISLQGREMIGAFGSGIIASFTKLMMHVSA